MQWLCAIVMNELLIAVIKNSSARQLPRGDYRAVIVTQLNYWMYYIHKFLSQLWQQL